MVLGFVLARQTCSHFSIVVVEFQTVVCGFQLEFGIFFSFFLLFLLQVQGLGTALKVLFSEQSHSHKGRAFLRRTEIVSLFNVLGR